MPIAQQRRLFQDCLHSRVGRERFTLGNAQRGEFAVIIAIGFVSGFAIDQFVQALPVLEVVLHLQRRIVGCRLPDTFPGGFTPVWPGSHRINLNGFHQIVGGLDAALGQRSQQQYEAIGRATADEIARRYLALITRRQQQMLAALAGIRSWQAKVSHPALIKIVRHANQRPRWQFYHQRSG
ncbi:hypothetical protein D3C85_938480 [compost metagenome]